MKNTLFVLAFIAGALSIIISHGVMYTLQLAGEGCLIGVGTFVYIWLIAIIYHTSTVGFKKALLRVTKGLFTD